MPIWAALLYALCLNGEPKIKEPSWGMAFLFQATSGAPQRGGAVTATKLECWQKPQLSAPTALSATAEGHTDSISPSPGEQAGSPLPTQGPEEGTAPLLIGINDSENYKAGPLCVQCPGGWDSASMLRLLSAASLPEMPSWALSLCSWTAEDRGGWVAQDPRAQLPLCPSNSLQPPQVRLGIPYLQCSSLRHAMPVSGAPGPLQPLSLKA